MSTRWLEAAIQGSACRLEALLESYLISVVQMMSPDSLYHFVAVELSLAAVGCPLRTDGGLPVYKP